MALNLQKLRQEKQLSLRDLAEHLQVHYTTISYWEQGKKKPKNHSIKNLENFFGLPKEEILRELVEDE